MPIDLSKSFQPPANHPRMTRHITDKFPGDISIEVGASYGMDGVTIHARDTNSGVTFSEPLWLGGRYSTPDEIWEALQAVFAQHKQEETEGA